MKPHGIFHSEQQRRHVGSILAGCFDIGDDQIEALRGAGRGGRDLSAKDDRAPGSGRRELDYAKITAIAVVGIESPPKSRSAALRWTKLAANSSFAYWCAGAIDLTGNGESGGYDYFTTGNGPSSIAPVLVQANPPNGFANVPLNDSSGAFYPYTTNLQLQFSEPVSSASLGGITLSAGGTQIPVTAIAQSGNTIVTVQLPTTLLPNTLYTYGVSGVTDYSGNLITPVTSSFTTGSGFDFSSPTLTATNWTSAASAIPTPLNGASGVDDNPVVSLVFSEAMDPTLIDGNHVYLQVHNTQAQVQATITFSADYTTVYLTPTLPLAAGTIYDLVTSGIYYNLTDIAGNSYSAQGDVATFTTQ